MLPNAVGGHVVLVFDSWIYETRFSFGIILLTSKAIANRGHIVFQDCFKAIHTGRKAKFPVFVYSRFQIRTEQNFFLKFERKYALSCIFPVSGNYVPVKGGGKIRAMHVHLVLRHLHLWCFCLGKPNTTVL